MRLPLLVIIAILLTLGCAFDVHAQTNAIQSASPLPDIKLEIPIAGQDTVNLHTYIIAAYQWLIGAGAILAVLMIMIAGVRWLTAEGSGRVKEAQTAMTNALVGLGLILCSYLILYTINTRLVELHPLNLSKIDNTAIVVGKAIPESGVSTTAFSPPLEKVQMKPPYTTLAIPSTCPARNARMTQDIIDGALANQHKYGIPAAIILAQWALESTYGASPSGTHNYFGIKCTKSSPPCSAGCAERTTQEEINGRKQTMNQCFQNFSSVADGLEGHAKYLTLYHTGNKIPTKTGNWYDVNGSPYAFAQFLQTEGYATDSGYASKLQNIMRENCLVPTS